MKGKRLELASKKVIRDGNLFEKQLCLFETDGIEIMDSMQAIRTCRDCVLDAEEGYVKCIIHKFYYYIFFYQQT